jgi:DNA-binding transcriptional regulator YiaG
VSAIFRRTYQWLLENEPKGEHVVIGKETVIEKMKSRRSQVASSLLLQETRSVRRKAYTGNLPITGEEWQHARLRFGYTQREFGDVINTHSNTVARWERDEIDFPHPKMARLAIAQHSADIREGRTIVMERISISGAEWKLYRESLGMSQIDFGDALDAHVSTIEKWEGDTTEFPHPNMARLAIRKLYRDRQIPFPIVKIKMTLSAALPENSTTQAVF